MFGVFRDYLYSSGAVVRGESEIINDFVFATIRCLLYYMLLVCSTYVLINPMYVVNSNRAIEEKIINELPCTCGESFLASGS